MPHCILEYPDVLKDDMPAIAQKTHDAAFATGLFNLNAIKVRGILADNMLSGGEPAPHLSVTAKILAGRTPEQKEMLAKSLCDALQDDRCSVSVEVVDLDTYCK